MSIPEGFKLVPVEPTEEMIESVEGDSYTFATGDEEWEGCVSEDMARDIYTRMLAAAPTPPQPIYDDSSIRGWEVGSRLFRIRLDAHKYITSGQSHVDGNGSKLEPLYRAKSVEVGDE